MVHLIKIIYFEHIMLSCTPSAVMKRKIFYASAQKIVYTEDKLKTIPNIT
jgi:hypothetical protein